MSDSQRDQTAERNEDRPTPRLPPRFWLAMTVGLGVMFLLDGPVLALVRPLHDSGFSDLINHTIRQLGTGHVQVAALLILVLLGAALKARSLTAAGGWGALSLAISAAAATILKVLIHRPRPWFQPPEPATWKAGVVAAIEESKLRAFPSGESTATFAVVWTFAYFCPALRWPLLGVAVLVAAARVLVGAHHPSDVWAGAMLGIAVGEWVAGLARARARRGGPSAGSGFSPSRVEGSPRAKSRGGIPESGAGGPEAGQGCPQAGQGGVPQG